MIEQELSQEDILHFLEEGYIECKKGFFGRKKRYELTPKGIEYLEGKMLDKLKYIQ